MFSQCNCSKAERCCRLSLGGRMWMRGRMWRVGAGWRRSAVCHSAGPIRWVRMHTAGAHMQQQGVRRMQQQHPQRTAHPTSVIEGGPWMSAPHGVVWCQSPQICACLHCLEVRRSSHADRALVLGMTHSSPLAVLQASLATAHVGRGCMNLSLDFRCSMFCWLRFASHGAQHAHQGASGTACRLVLLLVLAAAAWQRWPPLQAVCGSHGR